MSKKWTNADDDLLRDAYATSRPLKDVAAELGISSGALHMRVRKLGIARSRSKPVPAQPAPLPAVTRCPTPPDAPSFSKLSHNERIALVVAALTDEPTTVKHIAAAIGCPFESAAVGLTLKMLHQRRLAWHSDVSLVDQAPHGYLWRLPLEGEMPAPAGPTEEQQAKFEAAKAKRQALAAEELERNLALLRPHRVY